MSVFINKYEFLKFHGFHIQEIIIYFVITLQEQISVNS